MANTKVNLRDESDEQIGTQANPLKVDPNGNTTQPVSSSQLPSALTDGGLKVFVVNTQVGIKDNQGSITVDSPQLPAALTETGELKVSVENAISTSFEDDATRELGRVRLRNPGNTVDIGDSSNPVRVDPTGTTTQPVSFGSLPLPSGAATEATLATRLAESTFTGRINTQGQKAMAASTPVVLASDQSTLAVGDGGGSLTVDGTVGVSGTVAVSAASLPLPTGAATETTLGTRLAETTFTTRVPVNGQAAMAASIPVTLASNQSALPVTDNAGSLTVDTPQLPASLVSSRLDINVGAIAVSIPAGTNNIGDVDVLTYPGPTAAQSPTTLGQKTMANSFAVVLASDQASVPVAATLQAGSASVGVLGANSGVDIGDVTINNASGGSAVNIQDGGNTITVDGTVTAQDGGGSLTIDSTQLPAALGQTTMSASLAVTLASNQSALAISAASLPLPTDAATETTLAALNTKIPASPATDRATAAAPFSNRLSDGSAFYDSTKTGQLPTALVGGRLDANVGAWLGSTAPTVGSKTSANSVPVVIASDQGAVTVAQATAASLKVEAVGTKTNNNAAPGATNLGALVAVANAAAPTQVETNLVALRVNLAGDLAVTLDGEVPTVAQSTGQGRTLQFAAIAQGAAGTTQLVAAAGGSLKIKVVSYAFVMSAAGTAKFTGTGDLSGAMDIAANGGVAAVGQVSSHLFETTANVALSIVTTTGAARGHLAYFTEN